MTTLISLDPGMSTGICIGTYSDTAPWIRKAVFQVGGGLPGFLEWYRSGLPDFKKDAVWVSEKFILRANDFVADLTAVRIEAALETLGIKAHYQLRTAKALIPDHTLKRLDLWLTGKDVMAPDANDANDATRHALVYMRTHLRHQPTISAYWPDRG